MYIVNVPKNFKGLDGDAFKKAKRDKDGKMIEVKDSGLPAGQKAYEVEDAGYLDELKSFCNSIFTIVQRKVEAKEAGVEAFQFEDSSVATDIIRAINVAFDHDVLELEKAPWEWLCKQLKNHGISIYRANAMIMAQPILDAEHVEPGRQEKKRELKAGVSEG